MLLRRMGLISVILILLFLGFSSVVNHSISRKTVENSGSRSFITFKSNVISQKACNCSSAFACSCCEFVKIFYSIEEKQLCFNIIYQRNGLNFDLTLDSLMIKAMTVTNYKPFRMCSFVPGLFFTMICVQILELNQFERSITVCPRVEVVSSKERWQINYICSSISTVLPALVPSMTMTMGMPMQMMPVIGSMTPMNLMPGQMMSVTGGQQPAMTQMPNSPPMGQSSAPMGQKPAVMEQMPATVSMGQAPAPAAMGQKPATVAMSPMPATAPMGQTSAPMAQKPATATMGQMPAAASMTQKPAPASMTSMPAPAPSGQMSPPMTMIQIPTVPGMNLNPAGAAMIIISGAPSTSGQSRPPSSMPGATPAPMSPAAIIMPRPANSGMMFILRPLAKSKLLLQPDEFEIRTLNNLTDVKQESDTVENLSTLNKKSKEVTNFNVQESITYSIKSDSVSKSTGKTLENEHRSISTDTPIDDKSLKSLKRQKRNYDIFEAFHQSDRCERAYKICVTKSKNYIVSRLRNSRNKNKVNKTQCSNKPARIVYGPEEELCNTSESSATVPETHYTSNQTNDSLDAIIINDESSESYDFNPQNVPFPVSLNPSIRPSIFPLRTPPLIALQIKEELSKIINNSNFQTDLY